jgi:hypothetical protein
MKIYTLKIIIALVFPFFAIALVIPVIAFAVWDNPLIVAKGFFFDPAILRALIGTGIGSVIYVVCVEKKE